jgi:hypothetical protein
MNALNTYIFFEPKFLFSQYSTYVFYLLLLLNPNQESTPLDDESVSKKNEVLMN